MDGRRALGVPKRQFPWIQLEDSIVNYKPKGIVTEFQ